MSASFQRGNKGSFHEDSNILSVFHGTDAFLLEDELNESQWNQIEARAEQMKIQYTSGILSNFTLVDKGTYAYLESTDGKPFNVLVDGYVAKVGGNFPSNPDSADNRIIFETLHEFGHVNDDNSDNIHFIEFWFEVIDHGSVVRKFGGVDTVSITNNMWDNRINTETSRRIQLRWKINHQIFQDLTFGGWTSMGDNLYKKVGSATTNTDGSLLNPGVSYAIIFAKNTTLTGEPIVHEEASVKLKENSVRSDLVAGVTIEDPDNKFVSDTIAGALLETKTLADTNASDISTLKTDVSSNTDDINNIKNDITNIKTLETQIISNADEIEKLQVRTDAVELAHAELARKTAHSGFTNLSGIDFLPTVSNEIRLLESDVLVNGHQIKIKDHQYIVLPEPPTYGEREDFVFLEAFWTLKNVGDPIYKNNYVDEAVERTATVSENVFEYRIRSIAGLDFEKFPEGFSNQSYSVIREAITAQGGNAVPLDSYQESDDDTVLSYYQYRRADEKTYNFTYYSDDVGLYFTGTGNQLSKDILKTTDGFIYAIPLFRVKRRNIGRYSEDNLNGTVNRIYPTFDRSNNMMKAGETAIWTVVSDDSDYDVLKIGDKLNWYAFKDYDYLVQITKKLGNNQIEVICLNPGLDGIGTIRIDKFVLLPDRPDNKYADIIYSSDLIDLRHKISLTGENYQQLLEDNFNKLLRGELHTKNNVELSKERLGLMKAPPNTPVSLISKKFILEDGTERELTNILGVAGEFESYDGIIPAGWSMLKTDWNENRPENNESKNGTSSYHLSGYNDRPIMFDWSNYKGKYVLVGFWYKKGYVGSHALVFSDADIQSWDDTSGQPIKYVYGGTEEWQFGYLKYQIVYNNLAISSESTSDSSLIDSVFVYEIDKSTYDKIDVDPLFTGEDILKQFPYTISYPNVVPAPRYIGDNIFKYYSFPYKRGDKTYIKKLMKTVELDGSSIYWEPNIVADFGENHKSFFIDRFNDMAGDNNSQPYQNTLLRFDNVLVENGISYREHVELNRELDSEWFVFGFNSLDISVSDKITGFINYNPVEEDVKAFFNGWKYVDGNTWVSLTGSGEIGTQANVLDERPVGFKPYKLTYLLETPEELEFYDCETVYSHYDWFSGETPTHIDDMYNFSQRKTWSDAQTSENIIDVISPVSNAHLPHIETKQATKGTWSVGDEIYINSKDGLIGGTIDTDTAVARIVESNGTNILVIDDTSKLSVGDTVRLWHPNMDLVYFLEIDEIDSISNTLTMADGVGPAFTGGYIVEVTESSSSPVVKSIGLTGTWSNLGTEKAKFTITTSPTVNNIEIYYSINYPVNNGIEKVPTEVLTVNVNGLEYVEDNMFTLVENFEDKVFESEVRNPHIIKAGVSSNVIGTRIPGNGIEEDKYDVIKSLDGNLIVNSTSVNNSSAYNILSFNLLELVERNIGSIPQSTTANKVNWLKENINLIELRWYGFGSGPLGDKISIATWHDGVKNWTNYTQETHDFSETTELLVYLNPLEYVEDKDAINSNGFINYLVYADKSDGVIPSIINTDYIELMVEIDAAEEGYDVFVPKEGKKALIDSHESFKMGENLLPLFTENDIAYGTVVINSPLKVTVSANSSIEPSVKVKENSQYTLSSTNYPNQWVNINFYNKDNVLFDAINDLTTFPMTFETPPGAVKVSFEFFAANLSTTYENCMLTIGDSTNSFVPFSKDIKIKKLVDFYTKMNGFNLSKAFEVKSTTLKVPNDIVSSDITEFTKLKYNSIGSTNGVLTNTTSNLTVGMFAQQLYEFDLSFLGLSLQELKKVLKNFTIKWNGYGAGSNAGALTNGALVKVLLNEQWMTVSSNSSNSPSQVVINTNDTDLPENFINTDQKLYVLVHSMHPASATINSSLYTDYISLEIDSAEWIDQVKKNIVKIKPNTKEIKLQYGRKSFKTGREDQIEIIYNHLPVTKPIENETQVTILAESDGFLLSDLSTSVGHKQGSHHWLNPLYKIANNRPSLFGDFGFAKIPFSIDTAKANIGSLVTVNSKGFFANYTQQYGLQVIKKPKVAIASYLVLLNGELNLLIISDYSDNENIILNGASDNVAILIPVDGRILVKASEGIVRSGIISPNTWLTNTGEIQGYLNSEGQMIATYQ